MISGIVILFNRLISPAPSVICTPSIFSLVALFGICPAAISAGAPSSLAVGVSFDSKDELVAVASLRASICSGVTFRS